MSGEYKETELVEVDNQGMISENMTFSSSEKQNKDSSSRSFIR